LLIEGLTAAADLFFTPLTVMYLLIGVVIGLIFGFVPGLSGITVLIVLLPFVLPLQPVHAIALILGAHAVIVTGDTITAILFNIPGTAQSVATCFDGFPLAQQGRASEAIAAGLTASMIGGIFGAVFLMLTIPIFRPLVLALGSAEYFMMILIGITMIAMLGGESFLKGLISGGLGLLCSFIGFDVVTGSFRYTLGSNYLYSGLNFVPVMIGIFAIAQMLSLSLEGGSIAKEGDFLKGYSGILKGIAATLKNLKVCLRGSVLGVIVGIIPGIGGTVANILAYGVQVGSSIDRSLYGKGEIKGVIAPESANNAKEGGALITTLAFGIPGSAGMAVLMTVLILKGIVPGPNMITENLDITISFVLVLIFANILAALMAIMITPALEKITIIPIDRLVPLVLVVCALGAFSINERLADVILAFIFGLVGFLMKKYQYSPAAFIIGFLLGARLERALHVSLRAWGPLFIFQRPISALLFFAMLIMLFWPFLRAIWQRHIIHSNKGEDKK
jgi:putative tricarboxylic transport membrane protein